MRLALRGRSPRGGSRSSRCRFGNDSMAYVFDLDVNVALGLPGWFFVFQEPRAVPRYGFDVSSSGGSASWNDLGVARCADRTRRSSSTSIRRWRSGLPIRAAPRGAARPRTWRPSPSNVRSGSSSTPGHSSMSNLSDLIKARGQLVARREQLSACETALVDNELRTRNATARAPGGAGRRDRSGHRGGQGLSAARARACFPRSAKNSKSRETTLIDRNRHPAAEVETLEAAEPALWTSTGVPVVLFPVRLETCFKPAASGWDLLVRIYPDDLHLDCPTRPAHRQRSTRRDKRIGNPCGRRSAIGGTLKQTIAEAWKALGQAGRSRAHGACRRRDAAGERASGI